MMTSQQIADAVHEARVKLVGQGQGSTGFFGDIDSLKSAYLSVVTEESKPTVGGDWRWVSDDTIVTSEGEVWRREPVKHEGDKAWVKVDVNPNDLGYPIVRVGGKARLLSHIVLEAFVGPRPEGMYACHFPNRDTTNNSLANLRWDTPKANSQDTIIHRWEDLGIDAVMVDEVCRLHQKCGLSRKQISLVHNFTRDTVTDILVSMGVATNESLEASDQEISKAGSVIGSKGASNGGKVRASKLTPERRSEIARLGGLKRWGKAPCVL